MADCLEGNSSDEELGELDIRAVQRRHYNAGYRRGRTVGAENALQAVFNSSFAASYALAYRASKLLGIAS